MSAGMVLCVVVGGYAAGAATAYVAIRYVDARFSLDLYGFRGLMVAFWPLTLAGALLWYMVARPVSGAGARIARAGERHREVALERARIRAQIERELLP